MDTLIKQVFETSYNSVRVKKRHVQRLLFISLAIFPLLWGQSFAADFIEIVRSSAITSSMTSMESRSSQVPELPLSAIERTCRKISKKLGSVQFADCFDRGLEFRGGKSVLGEPILVKEYPPLARRKPLGKVLVIGGIHGDEFSSISIVFKWMQKLDKYHSGLFHWRVIPLLNPDGLLRLKSQRMNENGVDLNRNFPTPDWHVETANYWKLKTHKNPRRYPGVNPLSEPESKWITDFIAEFKPDVIVSIHAPYGVLDFDGPKKAPKKLGHLYLNLLGTYPGSLGNYAGTQKEIPVVTIELPYAGILPSSLQISRIWVDLVRWLRLNMSTPEVIHVKRQLKTITQTDPS